MSTRPPPAGEPPNYAFVARMYKRSLRPVVMAITLMSAIWSFLWGVSALVDNSGLSNSLMKINIALGALYVTVGAIEIFGFIAAWKQILRMAQIYAYLSILAAAIVISAESLRFSTYFTRKQELIDSCTAESTGVTFYTGRNFWGNGGSTETLTQGQAARYCNDAWNRSVWGAVAWLLIATLLAFFFISIAFSFLHQLLSPPQQIPASQAYRMGAFGSPYNPQSGYQYPAPPGPPPQREDYVPPYDPAKLPGYGDSTSKDTGDVKDVPGGSIDRV